MKKLIATIFGAGLVLGAAPAFAGEWRLDASRCPDIREDWRDARENRRDERYDYGRRDRIEDRYDRREDRRDRAITICPRSAFYYVDGRKDHRGRSGWNDNDWSNGYARDGYYGRDNAKYRGRSKAPSLKLKYDRRLRLQYTTATGRKIYVRG